jgi:hypothetical protein
MKIIINDLQNLFVQCFWLNVFKLDKELTLVRTFVRLQPYSQIHYQWPVESLRVGLEPHIG